MSSPKLTTEAYIRESENLLEGAVVVTEDAGRMLVAEDGGVQIPISQLEAYEFTFTEVTGDGASSTYVATCVVPAGYSVDNIRIGSTVVWDATTTATLTIGDGDSSTGYVNAKNLKAAGDIPANTSGAWTYDLAAAAGTYAKGKYYAAAGLVTMTINVNDNGTNHGGRTRIKIYLSRGSKTVIAATHTV